MTAFITWNIQAGRGVDGFFDLARIARVLRALGEAEVICLQEVARWVPEIDDGADQVAVLASFFPEYKAYFGPAVYHPGINAGQDQAFGNLVLMRLPVLQVFQHPLPQPADLASKNMPRQAMEIIAAVSNGPLRIVTTHLEFFSALQRAAQIMRLRELYAEASAASPLRSSAEGKGIFAPLPRPVSSILCGDFNCEVQSEHYQCLIVPFPNATPAICDAWGLVNPGQPHEPTCGVFDTKQWPQGPHCRDFFFVSHDLASRVLAIKVNGNTDASDHQPLRMVLTD